MTVSRSLTLLTQAKLNPVAGNLVTDTNQSDYVTSDLNKANEASTLTGLILRDTLQKSNAQDVTKSKQILDTYGDNLVSRLVAGFSRTFKDVDTVLSARVTGRTSRVVKNRSGSVPAFSITNAAKMLAVDYASKEIKQRSYR